jgi:hypothetical protein
MSSFEGPPRTHWKTRDPDTETHGGDAGADEVATVHASNHTQCTRRSSRQSDRHEVTCSLTAPAAASPEGHRIRATTMLRGLARWYVYHPSTSRRSAHRSHTPLRTAPASWCVIRNAPWGCRHRGYPSDLCTNGSAIRPQQPNTSLQYAMWCGVDGCIGGTSPATCVTTGTVRGGESEMHSVFRRIPHPTVQTTAVHVCLLSTVHQWIFLSGAIVECVTGT